MTTFYILCGVMAVVWLVGLGAGLLGLGRSVAGQERLWPGLFLPILAVGIGWFGMTFFHVRYSRTVNGSGWAIESKWFFLVPLLLGVASLSLMLWKWRMSKHAN